MLYNIKQPSNKIKTTKKSEIEMEMEKILEESETIVDENYLTTNDTKRILNKGYRLLSKCEELRKSRDNWRNRYEVSNESK